LCATLKGSAQIFWPLQRMPVSPRVFQTPKVLPKKQISIRSTYRLFYQRPQYLVNRFAQLAFVPPQRSQRKFLPDPTNARSGKNPIIWAAFLTCNTERLFTLSLPAPQPLCQKRRSRPHLTLSPQGVKCDPLASGLRTSSSEKAKSAQSSRTIRIFNPP
jgi:hypothetical protein